MDTSSVPMALDRNDPNYDSDSDGDYRNYYATDHREDPGIDALKDFKECAQDIMAEYFMSGVVDEVAIQLTSIDSSTMNHVFVKKSITFSLDRGAREKEMTSALLSYLYGEVLSPSELRRGFHELFLAAEEIFIDVPDSLEDLSKFTARAAVDDILTPAFINELEETYGSHNSAAAEIVRRTVSILQSRHRAESMHRCWGKGAASAITEVKQSIDKMIEECLISDDVEEACTCLREIKMPFFHHHTVKSLILKALGTIEKKRVQSSIVKLMSEFVSRNIISGTQMIKGFKRIADNIDDICLDIPNAKKDFEIWKSISAEKGWLEC